MAEHHAVLINLIAALGSATLVAIVFHFLGLPVMVGFLIAGVVVGPNGLGLVQSLGEVEFLAEVAAVLLLFTLGLEFSWRTVLSVRKLLVNLGLAQVLLTAGLVAVFARWIFGLNWSDAAFAGCLIAMSSTAAVLKLLHDQRHLETPFGKASLGILLSQDLIVIGILLLLPLMSRTGETAWEFLTWMQVGEFIARGGLVVGLLAFGTRYAIPFFLDQVSQTRSREVFFFSVIFLCSGIALLMQSLGLSLSLGAFCAGVMVSESPYGRQTMSDIMPLRNNFLSIFFVAIGMLLNLSFVWDNLILVLGVLSGVVALKAIVIILVMWMLGNPGSLAVTTGLILAQVGEFSFILLDHGVKFGLVNEFGRQLFLAIAIGSLTATPFLYKLAMTAAFRFDYDHMIPKQLQKLAFQLRESLIRDPMQVRVQETNLRLSALEPIKGHTILIGFGIAAQNLADTFKILELPYRILEMNNSTVKKFRGREPIFFGDATQAEILRAVHTEVAHLVVIAVTGAEIAGAIHRAVRQLNPKVPVIVRTQYLRDLAHLEDHPDTEIVIAEFEGTLALLAEALKIYGVGADSLDQFLNSARDRLDEEHRRRRAAPHHPV
jgi:monovalent cation:H+ antiporter-2, CPA2 family